MSAKIVAIAAIVVISYDLIKPTFSVEALVPMVIIVPCLTAVVYRALAVFGSGK